MPALGSVLQSPAQDGGQLSLDTGCARALHCHGLRRTHMVCAPAARAGPGLSLTLYYGRAAAPEPSGGSSPCQAWPGWCRCPADGASTHEGWRRLGMARREPLESPGSRLVAVREGAAALTATVPRHPGAFDKPEMSSGFSEARAGAPSAEATPGAAARAQHMALAAVLTRATCRGEGQGSEAPPPQPVAPRAGDLPAAAPKNPFLHLGKDGVRSSSPAAPGDHKSPTEAPGEPFISIHKDWVRNNNPVSPRADDSPATAPRNPSIGEDVVRNSSPAAPRTSNSLAAAPGNSFISIHKDGRRSISPVAPRADDSPATAPRNPSIGEDVVRNSSPAAPRTSNSLAAAPGNSSTSIHKDGRRSSSPVAPRADDSPAAVLGNASIGISKDGVRNSSLVASSLGNNSLGNSTERRPERYPERPAKDMPAATVVANSSQRAAWAGAPWRRNAALGILRGALRGLGTHRVLAMDVTLAPRDPRAPGQFGNAVAIPAEKQEEAKSRWKEGNFNVYLSDLIPVDRAIADTRPVGCSEQRVPNDLPTTSVIMCFVDEVWSALLRSVHSVLSRSPPHLLEELILVDDCSSKGYLKGKLDKYMSRFPKVKILRLGERHGLIRARLAGAEVATGDARRCPGRHAWLAVGWLEPLLERVRLSRAKVACPVIEVISDKDMSYMTVDNFQRGIFTWPMNFGWRQIPQEVIEKNKMKKTDVIRCPVMAGGLFSIDRRYFFELGTYDPGLEVWGGENMELSFKVWMCGGEVEIIPCSRVGHIFRNDNPYSFPKDRISTVERNLARVAEVWLDEYKDLFYGHAYHLLLKNLDVGNLTQQIELRKKLQCKSFKWYLENVYPDLEAPLVRCSGLLVNTGTSRCLAVENGTLALESCDDGSAVWACLALG
ncbi:PREDICTED: polypeptide N-acetylgalactosaminyltransferase 5 [Tinamus guttatus]|uniref:polypeptide N-acetylgalactosaminyltransferase 5 n=1 Tax=Tinamus guttatus TaxID=94827 RepID=UPI00052F0085|nr:PREDICTED: polypeptide N-acetylgalactosaminyltransferase 5 [Tinamus guttatus]